MLPSSWPKWVVAPLALGIVGLVVVLGLVLGSVALAVSPQAPPTPTTYRLPYALEGSDGCVACHVDTDSRPPHDRLGCVTCHEGDGEVEDKLSAHEGLVADPTDAEFVEDACLSCHHSVRSEIPEHYIHAPHEKLISAIEEGEELLGCSVCHGGVAHGESPVGNHDDRQECIECHVELGLPEEWLECAGCHTNPHDVNDTVKCDSCHVSTRVWSRIRLDSHPTELVGRHAELYCFECHVWPNMVEFSDYACEDCHAAPHVFKDQPCRECARCHESQSDWGEVEPASFDHSGIWDYHVGAHVDVGCRGCHFEGYEAIPDDCGSCHALDPDTCSSDQACSDCHLSDASWSDVGP